MSARGQLILERVSRVIEGRPGLDARAIRVRAGLSRKVGDAALDRLRADGWIERARLGAEWTYVSRAAYRVEHRAGGGS